MGEHFKIGKCDLKVRYGCGMDGLLLLMSFDLSGSNATDVWLNTTQHSGIN